MSSHLLRLSKSIPLLKLRNGGTLLIRSSFPATNLNIFPEWREDGLISLEQSLIPGDKEARLTVMVREDEAPRISRTESEVSIEISPQDKYNEVFLESIGSNAQEKTRTLSVFNSHGVITDNGSILPDSVEYAAYRRVAYSDGLTHVSREEILRKSSLQVKAWVPEKVNLKCNLLEGGNILIDKKIEGDIHLFSKYGDVVVRKLRGHDISISTHSNGAIHITDVIEAQNISISTPGRVRAKRILGNSINIKINKVGIDDGVKKLDVDDEGACIDISSLYVPGRGQANLNVASSLNLFGPAIRVKSNHGHVTAKALVPPPSSNEAPVVDLGGVNGTCDVLISLSAPVDENAAPVGRMHVDSLSPDSISFFTATDGNLCLTIDRKLESDFRMLSHDGLEAVDTRDLLGDDDIARYKMALKELDKSSLKRPDGSRISLKTESFTSDPMSSAFLNIDFLEGWVNNNSAEPDSRFDVKAKGDMGVGKIRLAGAASQALSGFSSDGGYESNRPLLAVATSGKITVESLSWLGAIARRYGLDESDLGSGKLASRKLPPPVEDT